ncbi:MAG TPA: hypothetical protein VD837_06330 [Terriglobales bacterium]|nr:hypothetical protein [Terriglobales bacterium]
MKRTIVLGGIVAALSVGTIRVDAGRAVPSGGSVEVAPRTAPEDDCTLGEVAPILNDGAGTTVERLRRSPRQLIERTLLAPGLRVEVAQGGCAHYGVQITFTDERKSAGRRPPDRLLSEALKLLTALKRRTESSAVNATVEILTAHQREAYEDGGVLQDREFPDVTVYVSMRDGENGRKVEVTYSLVL